MVCRASIESKKSFNTTRHGVERLVDRIGMELTRSSSLAPRTLRNGIAIAAIAQPLFATRAIQIAGRVCRRNDRRRKQRRQRKAAKRDTSQQRPAVQQLSSGSASSKPATDSRQHGAAFVSLGRSDQELLWGRTNHGNLRLAFHPETIGKESLFGRSYRHERIRMTKRIDTTGTKNANLPF